MEALFRYFELTGSRRYAVSCMLAPTQRRQKSVSSQACSTSCQDSRITLWWRLLDMGKQGFPMRKWLPMCCVVHGSTFLHSGEHWDLKIRAVAKGWWMRHMHRAINEGDAAGVGLPWHTQSTIAAGVLGVQHSSRFSLYPSCPPPPCLYGQRQQRSEEIWNTCAQHWMMSWGGHSFLALGAKGASYGSAQDNWPVIPCALSKLLVTVFLGALQSMTSTSP